MQRVAIEAALAVTARLGFHVRDAGLLESALDRPVTRIFGEYAYPRIELAAAAQTESITRNRAMIDGNKRTALVLMGAFLRVNGLRLQMDSDTACDLIMSVAQGQRPLEDSGRLIGEHIRAWA